MTWPLLFKVAAQAALCTGVAEARGAPTKAGEEPRVDGGWVVGREVAAPIAATFADVAEPAVDAPFPAAVGAGVLAEPADPLPVRRTVCGAGGRVCALRKPFSAALAGWAALGSGVRIPTRGRTSGARAAGRSVLACEGTGTSS